LNGLWVFIGVLGGIAAFGALGIVLGPLVLAMAASVLDAYMSHPPPPSKRA
jgi:predicted PurR-regulated permease PerM